MPELGVQGKKTNNKHALFKNIGAETVMMRKDLESHRENKGFQQEYQLKKQKLAHTRKHTSNRRVPSHFFRVSVNESGNRSPKRVCLFLKQVITHNDWQMELKDTVSHISKWYHQI